ncbi:MAG: SDR family NAD(P)-dependent oxidoreductase, partial [Fibrobacterota bacterium]
SGVGLSMARGLCRLGAKTVFLSRDAEIGRETEKIIRNKIPDCDIESMPCDLSDITDINRFADEFLTRFDSLDVLSCNAAVLLPSRKLSKQGIEMTFMVNYLSHFILAERLLPLLKNTDGSRLLTVSGQPAVIKRAVLDIDDLNSEENYSALKATLMTALAKVLFTFEFSERFQEYGIIANTFHPGLIKSGLGRNLPLFFKPFFSIASLFFSRDTKTGLYLAASPEVSGISGRIFSGCKPRRFKEPFCGQVPLRKLLWEKSLEFSGQQKND